MSYTEIRINNKSYTHVKKVSFSNGRIIWIDRTGKEHNTKKEYTKVIIHHIINDRI